MYVFAVMYFDGKVLTGISLFSVGVYFLLLLSAIVCILKSKATLLGKDDFLWTYSFIPVRCILISKWAAVQSNKISQLNLSPSRSRIITKQLMEFTVFVFFITSRGNDQGLRGNQGTTGNTWLKILFQRRTTESMTAHQACDPFLHKGFGQVLWHQLAWGRSHWEWADWW